MGLCLLFLVNADTPSAALAASLLKIRLFMPAAQQLVLVQSQDHGCTYKPNQ